MFVLPALLITVAAAAPSFSPQQIAWYRSQLGLSGAAYNPAYAGVRSDPVAEGLVAWRRLRQSSNLPFQDYSNFLLAHPGWPGEAQMRKAAEGVIQPDVIPPDQVIAFFTRFPATTPGGKVRYAEALAALGRPAEAQQAARAAWVSGMLSTDDESRLLGRFGGAFTQADQDERMERLLWDGAFVGAQRQLSAVSAARRPLYSARLAYQLRSPDAAQQGAALGQAAFGDAGYIYDRTNWLRLTGQEGLARAELAQPRPLDAPAYDAVKWLTFRLTFARSSAADGNWAAAYGIASQLAGATAPGTSVRNAGFTVRDPYTSLAWLAGIAALEHLHRPADAVAAFRAYGDASQSPTSRARGYYWAGRADLAAGDAAGANGYFQSAAAFPDKFYGQLALERLGRSVPAPPPADFNAIADADRTDFDSRDIVRAARILGQLGDWQDQTQFLRVIASGAAISDSDHLLAASLARELQRPDLGVMASRAARPENASDYVRSGFPVFPVPGDIANSFSFIHGIMRQESQFDRNAVSGAGARGMMQLMPGTAREQADKLGLGYDYTRLTSDPGYNMQLGAGYFGRIMDMFGGNYVLAIAAYNAGPGNVRRWIGQYGDPRSGGVDVLDWIEDIPFSETRGYVQNVLENTVVYDTINPARASQPQYNRLSYYLGKRTPG
ncbi:MAG TPA: lytic transglycosylase domain-containing protein [Sphingomonas sp.]